MGLLDVVPSIISAWRSSEPRELCFVSPYLWRVWAAMGTHQSQWVWYRRLFMGFARYPYVNTLRPLDDSHSLQKASLPE
eukprot:9473098-Pyramimonas_sp.AAC.1